MTTGGETLIPDLTSYKTTELILELFRRGIDGHSYAKLWDNYLKEQMAEYQLRAIRREREFQEGRDRDAG